MKPFKTELFSTCFENNVIIILMLIFILAVNFLYEIFFTFKFINKFIQKLIITKLMFNNKLLLGKFNWLKMLNFNKILFALVNKLKQFIQKKLPKICKKWHIKIINKIKKWVWVAKWNNAYA